MTRTRRAMLIAIGTLLIAFAALVTFYANEPFNVATIGGLAGIALIVWAARSSRRRDH